MSVLHKSRLQVLPESYFSLTEKKWFATLKALATFIILFDILLTAPAAFKNIIFKNLTLITISQTQPNLNYNVQMPNLYYLKIFLSAF